MQARIATIQRLGGAPPPIDARSQPTFANTLQSALSDPALLDVPLSVAAGSASAFVPGENGRLDETALSLIGIGNHRLAPAAAEAFRRMRADAAAQGIAIGATDSYRDYDQQVDLVSRKGLYSNGGLAAQPGTSQHGWGLALDLDVDESGLAWLRANAARYGFFEDVPREPWHWEFQHGR